MADDDEDARGASGAGDLLGPTGPRRSSFTPPPNDAESLEAAANVFNDDAIAAALAAELAKVRSGPIPIQRAAAAPAAPETAVPATAVPESAVPESAAQEPAAHETVVQEPVEPAPSVPEADTFARFAPQPVAPVADESTPVVPEPASVPSAPETSSYVPTESPFAPQTVVANPVFPVPSSVIPGAEPEAAEEPQSEEPEAEAPVAAENPAAPADLQAEAPESEAPESAVPESAAPETAAADSASPETAASEPAPSEPAPSESESSEPATPEPEPVAPVASAPAAPTGPPDWATPLFEETAAAAEPTANTAAEPAESAATDESTPAAPPSDPFAPDAPSFAPATGSFPPPSEADAGSPTGDADALRALYRGAPAPTVPASDAPPPPGYDAPASMDPELFPSDTRPRRRSLQDEDLARPATDAPPVASPATPPTSDGTVVPVTPSTVERLQSELHLQENEAREFAEWESSMNAIGTPEALNEVARARAELSSAVPAEPAVSSVPVATPAEQSVAPTPTDAAPAAPSDEPAAFLPPPADEQAPAFAAASDEPTAAVAPPVDQQAEQPATGSAAPAAEPASEQAVPESQVELTDPDPADANVNPFLALASDEPVTYLPAPAEEPAAFLPPPADEPAPFLAPPVDEPASALPPPADDPAPFSGIPAWSAPAESAPAEPAPAAPMYTEPLVTPVEAQAPADEPAAFLPPPAFEPAGEPAAFLPPPAFEPAGEPAAFLPPPAFEPAGEPAAFLPPPVQEPASGFAPPAEEPAASFPPPTDDATPSSVPPTSEPAPYFAPPFPEPAQALAPPVDEPAAALPTPDEQPFATFAPPTDEAQAPAAPLDDPFASFFPPAEVPAPASTVPADDVAPAWTPTVADTAFEQSIETENPFDAFEKMAAERQANEAQHPVSTPDVPAAPAPPVDDSPFVGLAPPTSDNSFDTFAAPADPRDLTFELPPVLPDTPVFLEPPTFTEPPALVEPAAPADGVAELYRAAGEVAPPAPAPEPAAWTPSAVEPAAFDPAVAPTPTGASPAPQSGVPSVFDDLLSGTADDHPSAPANAWLPPGPEEPPSPPTDETPGGRRPFGGGVERDDAVDPLDSIFGSSVGPVTVNTAGVAVIGEYLDAASRPVRVVVAEPVLLAEAHTSPVVPAETVGLEPTPLDQRVGRSARLFWLWFASSSSIVAVVFGTVIFGLGVSLRQAIVATLAGVALSFFPLGLGTLAGKRSGQPTMVISRATFGLTGNILPALVALVSRIFWGGALLWILGASASQILIGARLGAGLGATGLTLVAMAIGAVVAGVIAYFGYGLLARAQLVISIVSGIGIIGFIALTAKYISISTALTTVDGPWILVITGAVLVFSFVGLAWANSSAEVARYQHPGSSGGASMLWATFGAGLPSFILIAYGALLAASNSRLSQNIVTHPLDSLGRLLPIWYPAPLLAVTGLSLVSGVVMTMYSGGFTLQALGVRLRRSFSTLVVGLVVLGAGIFIAVGVTDYTQLLRDLSTTIAVPIAAWAGIFGAEVMMRRRRLDAASLLNRGGIYPDIRWFNFIALILVSVIGFGFLSATLPALSWEGYLFGAFGVPLQSELATSDVGVLVALVLGLVVTLASGIPAIHAQESIDSSAE